MTGGVDYSKWADICDSDDEDAARRVAKRKARLARRANSAASTTSAAQVAKAPAVRTAQLPAGKPARIEGLTGRSALNGQLATLSRYDESAERWETRCESGEEVRVRRANLVAIDAETSSSEMRVESALETLRSAPAGSEERRQAVEDLQSELVAADSAPTKEARPVLAAFNDGDGPRLLYEIENSMTGNWMCDAKNGTLQRVSSISTLPGPVGVAFARYRGMATQKVEEAAFHLGCRDLH